MNRDRSRETKLAISASKRHRHGDLAVEATRLNDLCNRMGLVFQEDQHEAYETWSQWREDEENVAKLCS